MERMLIERESKEEVVRWYSFVFTCAMLAYAKQTRPENGKTLKQFNPFPAYNPLHVSLLRIVLSIFMSLPPPLVCKKQ